MLKTTDSLDSAASNDTPSIIGGARANNKRHIAGIISRWLLIIVLVSYCLASALVYLIMYQREDRAALANLTDVISGGADSYRGPLEDDLYNLVQVYVPGLSNRFLSHPGNEIEEANHFFNQYIETEDFSEMTLVDRSGKIITSTDETIVNQRLNVSDFKPLLDLFEIEASDEGITSAYVDGVTIHDPSIVRYSAAVVPDTNMLLLVGLSQEDLDNIILYYANIPLVHEPLGKIVYMNASYNQEILWSSRDEDIGKSLADVGINLPADHEYDSEVIKCKFESQHVYLMLDNTNGFYIIQIYPESEIMGSMKLTFAFMISIMAVVFVLLYFLIILFIKRVVVSKLETVTHTLSHIASGNLEEKVDVRNTVEFDSLSNDINTTVDRLKEYIAEAKARIDKDLVVAKEIQRSCLPDVSSLPPRDEFSIAVSMEPAKEVGGDFYDFYFLDDSHLVLEIADVSGKSIPGAMFMMRSKALIKNRTMQGGILSEIIGDANHLLCEGNDAGMFVTVWMAILDIKTGEGIAINAGHEHPALRRKGGQFELIKYRHSPAMAVMDGIPYRQHEFKLGPGDCLFVYTDGVAEATDKNNELFGEKRTLEALNSQIDAGPQELIDKTKKRIDVFVGDAEQFDDITMLCLEYHGSKTDSFEN